MREHEKIDRHKRIVANNKVIILEKYLNFYGGWMTDIENSFDEKDHAFLMGIIQKLVESGIDTEKIKKLIESGEFHKTILDTIKGNWPKDALESIKRNSKENLAIERIEQKYFEVKLSYLWSEPFDLFEVMIHISQEISSEFIEEFHNEDTKRKDYTFEALIRLHRRACQVALEILALMQSGYPDGANARWRTLHEIAVTCFFIQNHSQETAERYLRFNEIESYKSIAVYLDKPELYREHQQLLPNMLLSKEEMTEIKKNKESLCEQFYPEYVKNYGWAIKDFPDLKEKLTFAKLERDVNLDHLRPYYLMANIAVHSGPKGIFFHLTTPENTVIPFGPSNWGMSTPGPLAAISLLHVNTALLLTKLNIRRLADLWMMQLLVEEIQKSFSKVHNDIVKKDEILSNYENL